MGFMKAAEGCRFEARRVDFFFAAFRVDFFAVFLAAFFLAAMPGLLAGVFWGLRDDFRGKI
jgi:hypothetical protein